MRIFHILVLVISISFLENCRPNHDRMGLIIHLENNNFGNAYELSSQMIEKYPNIAEAWYYFGVLSGMMEKYSDFTKALMNARTLEGNPNVYLPFSMEKGKMKLQEAVIVSEIHFFYINIGDVEKLVGKIAIEGEKEMNAKYLNIAEEKLNNAKLIDPGNARIEFLSKVIADYKKILSDTNE